MIGDSNDQSGTVGFLVGIVVLVFAGIVFSLMVDKRFRFSSGRASLEQDVLDQQEVRRKMEIRLAAAREQWKKKVQPFEGQEDVIRVTGAAVRSAAGELTRLRERRKDLAGEIADAEGAFRSYRADYRKQVRLAAAGEALDELSSLGGRTYRGVTISRVTADGMEIRHLEGISRLKPEDLAESWRERFQWHPEEHEKPPVEPSEPDGPVTTDRADEVVEDPVSPEERAGEAAKKKLAGLRRDVTEALRFLEKAEAELARARNEAQGGRGVSVPGSLETWADRIKRLESTSEKFRSQYNAARGRLATTSPGDPLLQEPAGR